MKVHGEFWGNYSVVGSVGLGARERVVPQVSDISTTVFNTFNTIPSLHSLKSDVVKG